MKLKECWCNLMDTYCIYSNEGSCVRCKPTTKEEFIAKIEAACPEPDCDNCDIAEYCITRKRRQEWLD